MGRKYIPVNNGIVRIFCSFRVTIDDVQWRVVPPKQYPRRDCDEMQAPVIGKADDHALMLELADVTFIQLGENRRELLFATQSNTMRLVRSVQEMAAALDGTDFIRVNQNIIVNMNRVTRYDYNEYDLLFEPAGLEQQSSCQVSRDNRSKVRKWFATY